MSNQSVRMLREVPHPGVPEIVIPLSIQTIWLEINVDLTPIILLSEDQSA